MDKKECEYLLEIDNDYLLKVITNNDKITNNDEEFLAYCIRTGRLFLSYNRNEDFIMGKKIISKEIIPRKNN